MLYAFSSVQNSIYFCVVTSTTVGFGDVTPQLWYVRLACVVLLPFSVAVLGECLGRIASVYLSRHNATVQQNFLTKSMTLCDLEQMDGNADGVVDKNEFLSFMLVALQKVDAQDIEDIMATFEKLDRSKTGTVTRRDIVQGAMLEELRSRTRRVSATRTAASATTNLSV